MKLNAIAIAAADIADRSGWSAVTHVTLSAELNVHRVSVARSAGMPDILTAARDVVLSDGMRYPRAAVELRIGELSHTQRGRIVHAIAKELAR